MDRLRTTCPCGTGSTYDDCCGPPLANAAQAGSPELDARGQQVRAARRTVVYVDGDVRVYVRGDVR